MVLLLLLMMVFLIDKGSAGLSWLIFWAISRTEQHILKLTFSDNLTPMQWSFNGKIKWMKKFPISDSVTTSECCIDSFSHKVYHGKDCTIGVPDSEMCKSSPEYRLYPCLDVSNERHSQFCKIASVNCIVQKTKWLKQVKNQGGWDWGGLGKVR